MKKGEKNAERKVEKSEPMLEREHGRHADIENENEKVYEIEAEDGKVSDVIYHL